MLLIKKNTQNTHVSIKLPNIKSYFHTNVRLHIYKIHKTLLCSTILIVQIKVYNTIPDFANPVTTPNLNTCKW